MITSPIIKKASESTLSVEIAKQIARADEAKETETKGHLSGAFLSESIASVLRSMGQSGVVMTRQYAQNKPFGTESRVFDANGMGALALHQHANYNNMIGLGELFLINNGYPYITRHNDDILRKSVISDVNDYGSQRVYPPAFKPSIAALPTGVNGAVIDTTGATQANYCLNIHDDNPQDIEMWLIYNEMWFEYVDENGEVTDEGESFRHSDDHLDLHKRLADGTLFSSSGLQPTFENKAFTPAFKKTIDADGNEVTVVLQYRNMAVKVGTMAKKGTLLQPPIITIGSTNHTHVLNRQLTQQESDDLRSGAITMVTLTSNDGNHLHDYEIIWDGTKFVGTDNNVSHQHTVIIEEGFTGEIPFDRQKALDGIIDSDNVFKFTHDTNLENAFGYSAEEGIDSRQARFTVEQLDRMIERIPGLDGEGAYIDERDVDSYLANEPSPLEDRDGGPLNSAYYSRNYTNPFTNAAGRDTSARSFNDTALFVARNTKEKCFEKVSYAIPLEIVALSPEHQWNPYEIPSVATKEEVTGAGSSVNPYDVYSDEEFYYLTPAALYAEAGSPDPADTSQRRWMKSGIDGSSVRCQATGIRPFTSDLNRRIRFPIYPRFQDGSMAMRDLAHVSKKLNEITESQNVAEPELLADIENKTISAYVTHKQKYGAFKFDNSDLSAEVTLDNRNGWYIAPTGEDGSNGAWVRQDSVIRARHFGSDPSNLTNSFVAWKSAAALAGEGGTWKVDPGQYYLTPAWETPHENQTILVDGVSYFGTIVQKTRGVRFEGRLTVDGSLKALEHPWIWFISRFGQGSKLDLKSHKIDTCSVLFGGINDAALANSGRIAIESDKVGLGSCVSVQEGGLLSYVLNQNLATESIGQITTAGSGYTDGRYLIPVRTLSGVGKDAIAGVKVENGVVTDFQPIFGGRDYATGDTITLDFPARASAREYYDEPKMVHKSMNPAYDAAAVEWRDAWVATGPISNRNSYAASVIQKQNDMDNLEQNEIGSGFVFTVGDVLSDTTWFNSNTDCSIKCVDASFGGHLSSGRANYNNYSIYLEAIKSKGLPFIKVSTPVGEVDNSIASLNVLVNSSFQQHHTNKKIIDFSGCSRLAVLAGRVVNPFVDHNQDPDWENTIVDFGTDLKMWVPTITCKTNNTKSKIRIGNISNGVELEFQPTISSNAVDDMTVVYTHQVGIARTSVDSLEMRMHFEYVPTFSTAGTGYLRVEGLPQSGNKFPNGYPIPVTSYSGIDITGTARSLFLRVIGTEAILYEARDGLVPRTVKIQDTTSGEPVIIEAAGSYDYVAP